MTWIQILGTTFGVFIAYQSFVFYKKREINRNDLSFWAFIGIVLIIINLFPSSLDYFLESLGFLRALDFLTIIGFIVIFVLMLYFNKVVRKNEKRMKELVEKIALRGKK